MSRLHRLAGFLRRDFQQEFSYRTNVLLQIGGVFFSLTIWYFVGRWRGKPVLDHLCRVSFNPDACLERAVDGFHRRKSATILFAKFLPGVNTIMPPLAGVAAMPFLLFLLLDFAGALLWAGAAVALGFAFGEEVAETARGFQGMLGWLLLAGLVATIAWRIAYRFWLVKRYGAKRLEPEEVHRRMREGEEILVLDLRRDDDYAASDRMIAGAVRVRPVPRRAATGVRVAHDVELHSRRCRRRSWGVRPGTAR